MADEHQQQTALVALVHGHHGSPEDHEKLRVHVEQAFNDRQRPVTVHCVRCNKGRTNDGVSAGGEGVAREIAAAVRAASDANGGARVALAVAGHSLGGLYLRAALPLLFEDAAVAPLCVPCSFVTMSTPHLGSARPGLGGGAVDVYLRISARTGEDLALRSAKLHELCDSRHTEALARFARRTLVATTDGDLTVPFGTASARLVNPHNARPWFWWATKTTAAAFSVVGHSGFSADDQAALGLRPETEFPAPSADSELLLAQQQGVEMPDGWVADTEAQVLTRPDIFRAMCSPSPEASWRRIDASFKPPTWSIARTHDMCIGKLVLPSDMPACHAYMRFVSQMIERDVSSCC